MAEKIEAWKSVDGSIHAASREAYMKDAEYYKAALEKVTQLAKQQEATIQALQHRLKVAEAPTEASTKPS